MLLALLSAALLDRTLEAKSTNTRTGSHGSSSRSSKSKRERNDVSTSSTPSVPITILREFPHDDQAFTQGLCFHNGELYEGTGLYGKSDLRKVDLETGKVLQSVPIARKFFGEGICVLNNKIYQITWKEKTGFVYDMDFKKLGSFDIGTDGWGLTTDGTSLILSDGSDSIFYMNPEDYKVHRTVKVKERYHGKYRSVFRINEMEFIDGYIYANIWGTTHIAIINPDTGIVLKWLTADNLQPPNPSAVENGIAFEPNSRRLFITGKLWPKLYEIQYEPISAAAP